MARESAFLESGPKNVFDRRSFLLGLASSLALPRRVASQVPGNPDVVVIGAGAAGLAATRTLMAMGYDVALLEAGARIGGRAHTNMSTWEAMTVSTGVLGSGAIAFTPPLPVAKQESFDGVSMGLYNHITLQFGEDIFGLGEDGYLFWQLRDEGGFGVLTNANGHGLAYCDIGDRRRCAPLRC